VQASTAEPYVEAIFWQQLSTARQPPTQKRRQALEAKVDALGLDLARYRDNSRLERTLGSERFEQGVTVRLQRLETSARAGTNPARGTGALPPAPELRARWATMAPEQKRLSISEVLDCAFARPGRGEPEEKLLVFPRGRAPADLAPYGSQRRVETKPLDPPAERGAVRLRAPERRPWSPLRLRRELAPFLDGRERWPTYAEFQAAGLGCLWRAPAAARCCMSASARGRPARPAVRCASSRS
jgi:hypothetical protein